jgi:hypothetical protein
MAGTDGNDEATEVSGPIYGQEGSLGGVDRPMLLVPAPTKSKKPKHQAPQEAVDEFWAKFNTKTPGKGK